MDGSDTTVITLPEARQPACDDRLMPVSLVRLWRALWRPAHARPDVVAAAHARRCALDGVTPADVRDIGLAREDATGVPTIQPDLPFFMQSGFGRKTE